MKTIIGIDPGKTGGVAVIKGDEITLHVMPVLAGELDLAAITDFFINHAKDSEVWLEQVHAMPKQGVSGVFTFGEGYGAIKGIIAVLRIPLRLVRPQKWQKVMYEGISGKAEGKDRSVLAAKRLFPLVDLMATERSKVPHMGLVDALLIAEFGRRQSLKIES